MYSEHTPTVWMNENNIDLMYSKNSWGFPDVWNETIFPYSGFNKSNKLE